ncbi:MAG: radical SAM protein [Ruminococcus sp.]|nr:radical SAM protein [Ruminococcus sp.]MBR6646025.1 radical SAM protein [Clostridia bacterium]
MKHSNISVFIPHIGCPNMCSFCNQRVISGKQKAPTAQEVKEICRIAFNEISEKSNTEIAFFGGSFTAIPKDYMLELLEAVQEFLSDEGFKGIRISTRPDCINDEILSVLKEYNVTAIELGAQSLSDKVLEANERGHNAEDVVSASELIREYGFELGLQMMIGLYKSTIEDEYATFEKILQIKPDTLRIYPVVILKNTRLAELYSSGEFIPFAFDDVVEMCAEFLDKAEKNSIKVIKCGLHASEFVENDMTGGFYHPAFRELCEGRIYRREIEKIISESDSYLKISVPTKMLSRAIGQKKCNTEYFREKGTELKIISDNAQSEYIKILERR